MTEETPWIKWTGGEPPVDGDIIVECQFRAPPHGWQVDPGARPASTLAWYHDGMNDDILAFRIVSAVPAPQAMSEGAFRMGARAMRDAAAARISGHTLAACIADLPLPEFPAPPAANTRDDWVWWSGSNDEHFTNGPFKTREAAIEALDGEGGFIVEAICGRVSFSADTLINDQYYENDDYFSGEHGEAERSGGADAIQAADAELQALLDGWLARWRHTFVRPEMFLASRNREAVEADPGVAWKGRFIRRWVELTGSLDAAQEHANAAWEAHGENDPDASPEEHAEAEVSCAREDGE